MHVQPKPQATSTATRELDELMATLSGFKVGVYHITPSPGLYIVLGDFFGKSRHFDMKKENLQF